MSQKYFFLIFGISQSDPAMVFSVDRAKCFRRCRHGVYVHDHGASRGYPRVAELSGAGAGWDNYHVCTEHQNLCDMVAKQPFDKNFKWFQLYDSKKMLSDTWCRFVLSKFVSMREGSFFKQKITHFVSFFFCFSKLKLIYPTWTRKISPSLSVIKIINFFFPLPIKCQLIMQRRHFQKDS